ncbi:uncharacterized protein LOC135488948 [Lineus longissimus]|uniref:uncharacterized protein LOC135488948 n=1 Tax=Lineus longissimus TaxID=88925 RepID=UPI00315D2D36
MFDSLLVLKMELKTILIAILMGLLQTPRHSVQNSIEYGAKFINFNNTFHEVQPNSAFKCPEQYFIWNIDITFLSMNLTKSFAWNLTSSYSFNDTTLKWMSKPEPCDSIRHCLGYQSCLFKFGNELCQKDPLPQQRKVLQVNYTCATDDLYSQKFLPFLSQHSGSPKLRNQHSLFMNARTLPDEDILNGDYAKANIAFNVINEEDVFMIECPPAAEARNLGFYGNCSLDPPASKDVAEDLWKVLGRVETPQCRREILDEYCAHKYNKHGDCIPPFFVEKRNSSKPPFSFNSLPKNGFRPDTANYVKVHRDPHMSLIPAKMGFFLLVHANAEAVFQLVDQIYRPHHFYVIHVDKRSTQFRKKIGNYIKEVHKNAKNIRVIPIERSFSTSWGSFQILRAELECYEELLRMGIWDFIVNLSGSDLALRDVDDLAAALAPHRAANLLRLNKPIWFVLDKPSRYAWYSCGAHVYNSSAREQKYPQVSGSSQFKIISRDFATFLVSNDRGDKINAMTHYLQTSIIPDESYIATILQHSRFKSTLLLSSTTLLKPFEGETANKLCKHSDDVDLCGSGPGTIVPHDFPKVQYETNHFYFARKFSPNHEDRTRLEVIKWALDGYYHEVSNILPRNMIGQMGELVIEKLLAERGESYLIEHIKFAMFRKLAPSDPCCEHPHAMGKKTVDEFGYWLDMDVVSSTKGKPEKKKQLRASLDMVKPSSCYPGGHLRMLNVNTRPDIMHPEGPDGPPCLFHNFPVPVQPSGGVFMWVNIYFHISPSSKACTDTEKINNADNRKYFSFPVGSLNRTFSPDGYPFIIGSANPTESSSNILRLFITVMDPKGKVHCWKDAVMDLSKLKISEDENSTMHTSILHCDPFYEGLWTVKVRDLKEDRPFNYKMSVYLYDEQKEGGIPYDIVKTFWTVTDVMFLPATDYYSDKSSEKPTKSKNVKSKGKKKTSNSKPIASNTSDGKSKMKNVGGKQGTPNSPRKGKVPPKGTASDRQHGPEQEDVPHEDIPDDTKTGWGLPHWNLATFKRLMAKIGLKNSECMKSDSKHMKELVKRSNEFRDAIYGVVRNKETYHHLINGAVYAYAYAREYFGGFGDSSWGKPGDQRGNKATKDGIENFLQHPHIVDFLKRNGDGLKGIAMKYFGENEMMKNIIGRIPNENLGELALKLFHENKNKLKSALYNALGDKQILVKEMLDEFLKDENGQLFEQILKNKNMRGYLMKFLKDGNLDNLANDFKNSKDLTLLNVILSDKLKDGGGLGDLIGRFKGIIGKESDEKSAKQQSEGTRIKERSRVIGKDGKKMMTEKRENAADKVQPTKTHIVSATKVQDALIAFGFLEEADRQNYVLDEPVQAVTNCAIALILQTQSLLSDDEALGQVIDYILEVSDIRVDELQKWLRQKEGLRRDVEDVVTDVIGNDDLRDRFMKIFPIRRFGENFRTFTETGGKGHNTDSILMSVFTSLQKFSQVIRNVRDIEQLGVQTFEFLKGLKLIFEEFVYEVLTQEQLLTFKVADKKKFKSENSVKDRNRIEAHVENIMRNYLQVLYGFEQSLYELENIGKGDGEERQDADDGNDHNVEISAPSMIMTGVSGEQEQDFTKTTDFDWISVGEGEFEDKNSRDLHDETDLELENIENFGRPRRSEELDSDEMNSEEFDHEEMNSEKHDGTDGNFDEIHAGSHEDISDYERDGIHGNGDHNNYHSNQEELESTSGDLTEPLPDKVLEDSNPADTVQETNGLPFQLDDRLKSAILGYYEMYSKTCSMGDCVQLCWLCMKSNPGFTTLKAIVSLIAGVGILISIMSLWIVGKNGSSSPVIVWLLSSVSLLSSSILFVMIYVLSNTGTRLEKEEL